MKIPHLIGWSMLVAGSVVAADKSSLPLVTEVEWQPVVAQIRRVLEATESQGSPLSESDQRALRRELDSTAAADALEHVQQILDRYCLAGVTINPESRVKIAQGPAKPELVEQGWRLFLVKEIGRASCRERV